MSVTAEHAPRTETVPVVRHRFADLGMQERLTNPLGIADAPAATVSRLNPRTGNRVHLTVVDYPVNGLGLEYLLEGIAHGPKFFPIFGIDTLDDWKLPDEPESFYEDPTSGKHLLEQHMKLPHFSNFITTHRPLWMERLSDSSFDHLFQAVWETNFIDPPAFTAHQVGAMRAENEIWKKSKHHWPKNKRTPALKFIEPLYNWLVEDDWNQLEHFISGNLQDENPLKQVLAIPNGDRSKKDEKYRLLSTEYQSEFFDVYLNTILTAPLDLQMKTVVNSDYQGCRLLYFDPATGKNWTKQFSLDHDEPIAHFPGSRIPVAKSMDVFSYLKGNTVNYSTHYGNVSLQLGDVLEDGTYATTNAVFNLLPRYKRNGLLPLIAWEETPEGRRFVNQDEAIGLLPQELRDPRLDVMLGTAVLAHGQPNVMAGFSRQMALHGEGDLQHMTAAQMPVFLHLPKHQERLLAAL